MEQEPAEPELVAGAEETAAVIGQVQNVIENPESFGLDKNSPAYKESKDSVVAEIGDRWRDDAWMNASRTKLVDNFLGIREYMGYSAWAVLKGVAEAHITIQDGRVIGVFYKDLQSGKLERDSADTFEMARITINQAMDELKKK